MVYGEQMVSFPMTLNDPNHKP